MSVKPLTSIPNIAPCIQFHIRCIAQTKPKIARFQIGDAKPNSGERRVQCRNMPCIRIPEMYRAKKDGR